MIEHVQSRPKFLRCKEVRERTGLSRSTIYQRIAQGTFPKAIPLGGRAVGWLEAEVNEWLSTRIQQRHAVISAPPCRSNQRASAYAA